VSLGTLAQTNRIVCIGDSITQAQPDHPSYRYDLWKMLIDSKVAFEFVGSITNNYEGNSSYTNYQGQVFDRDHEGHWGWRADEIESSLTNWLAGYTPDIALIHIGSNDMNQGEPHQSTKDEIKQIISLLRADNPNVVVLLCKLIPWNGKAPQTQDLNDNYIATIPGEVSSAQSPVILVDQFTGFDATIGADTYDNIHPNASGEIKIAQKFYGVLRSVLLGLVDEDSDGMHDQWEINYFGDLSHDETANEDADEYTDFAEYILGSNPTNALSSLNFTGDSVGDTTYRVSFQTEIGRQYRLEIADSLIGGSWQEFIRVNGLGDSISIEHSSLVTSRFYRVKVDWMQ
jgi:lysophospholipase L1-like esterase